MIAVIRRAILEANPEIEENEKWKSPNFTYRGADRVTLRSNPKGGVQLVFHRGASVLPDTHTFRFDDPTGLLEWRAPDRGVLTIRDENDAIAKSREITRLVRLWVVV